jgi:3',5'-cyclic AMP phosphodiesterase CpdA
VKYFYKIPSSNTRENRFADGKANSTEGWFKTPPEKSEKFSFIVYGDTRTDREPEDELQAHSRVVRQIRKHPADFGVIVGDLTEQGDLERQWQDFFDVEHDLMRFLPVYAVVGNHDEAKRAALLIRYFGHPTKSSGSEYYYSFIHGNSLFIVLDHHVHEAELLKGKQKDWLKKTLSENSPRRKPAIKHRFVFVHVPPFTVMDKRDASPVLKDYLGMFRKNGVEMIISGHDHHYAFGELPSGLTFMICGAAGAPLYDLADEKILAKKPFKILAAKKSYCFVKFDVDGEKYSFTAYDDKGEIIHRTDSEALKK